MKEAVVKLLEIFQGVKGLDQNFLKKVLSLPLEVLTEITIATCRLPLTADDLRQVEQTKAEARRLIKRGKHHTFCYIRGESGKLYHGLQRTYHRHGAEDTCAEEGAISDLSCSGETATNVVTVHYMPIPEREDGGITSIVAPCSDCSTRLRIIEIEQGKRLNIIVYHRGELIKVPSSIVVLFNYPSKHDHEK